MGVIVECDEAGAIGDKKFLASKRNDRLGLLLRAAAIGNSRGEMEQTFFEFAAKNSLDTKFSEPGFVHRRIEAVKANMRRGIDATDGGEKFDGEASGRMHGNVEGNERRAADDFFAKWLARQIETNDFVATRTKPCRGRSKAERLAAKLISRNEDNSHSRVWRLVEKLSKTDLSG